MVKIRWTDFALENLIAIGNYIEVDSPFYAKKVVNYLFCSVDIPGIAPPLKHAINESFSTSVISPSKNDSKSVNTDINQKKIRLFCKIFFADILLIDR